MMKKHGVFRVILLVLVLALGLGCLSGCGKEEIAIRQRIDGFVSNCNKLYVTGILDYVDAAIAEPLSMVQKTAEAAMKLPGITVDETRPEVFSRFAGYLIGENDLDAVKFFSSLEVSVVDIAVNGNEADVNVNITYVIDGVSFGDQSVIRMVRNDDIWYVKQLEL